MENNFINDFKIYSKTVDSTEGLEIVRNNILSYTLNLETFIDDYIDQEVFNDRNKIPSEAIRLGNGLIYFANEYKKILEQDVRELYLFLKGYDIDEIKDMLNYVLCECFEYIQNKYNYKIGPFYVEDLKEEHVEQWYKDLYLLFDKYDI